MFFICLISIVSDKLTPPVCKAICIFFSNKAFSSSSGSNSKKIPKSCSCNSINSFNVFVLKVLIAFINEFSVKGFSIKSATFKLIFSQTRNVIKSKESSKCLVAVFEAFAANF